MDDEPRGTPGRAQRPGTGPAYLRPSARAREHRHRRALLLGIAGLLLLSLTPVVGRHLLGAAHGPLTVITVLNRLVDKRVLERARRDDLLHYSARMTEPEFVAHASRRVVEGLLSFQPEAVTASMVDVLAERDPEQLAELARLIRRRMREQARDGRKGGAE